MGSNGTMFTLQAVRDVEINSFYTFVRSNSVDLVQVYTRRGNYSGFQSSDAGWDLVFDKSILLNGIDQVTELRFSSKVIMASGQFQSFYVYSPSDIQYRSEAVREGDLVKSDDSFRFFAGIAIAFGKFGAGQVYSPRVYSGIISYNTISIEPPTKSPTTKSPSKHPSKVNDSNRNL